MEERKGTLKVAGNNEGNMKERKWILWRGEVSMNIIGILCGTKEEDDVQENMKKKIKNALEDGLWFVENDVRSGGRKWRKVR